MSLQVDCQWMVFLTAFPNTWIFRWVMYISFMVSVVSLPDSTSTLQCGGNGELLSNLHVDCQIWSMNNGVPIAANFSDFGILTGEYATIQNIQSTAGDTHFSFSLVAGNQTGLWNLTSLYTDPIIFFFYDMPDETSTTSCETHFLRVQKSMNCKIIPKKMNNTIFTFDNKFFISGGHLTYTKLSPIGLQNEFYFTAFSTTVSEDTFIHNGISKDAWQVTLYSEPDKTSSLVCQSQILRINNEYDCIITARARGRTIRTFSSKFNLTGGNPGAAFSKIEGIDSKFRFSFITGYQTGHYAITDGFSTLHVDMYGIPDGTSILQCNDKSVAILGSIECISIPKQNNSTIHSRHDIWEPTALNDTGVTVGSFFDFGPYEVSTQFHFKFTAPYILGNITISDGISRSTVKINVILPELPDRTSSLVCDNTTILLYGTTHCTIHARKNGRSIWCRAEDFNLKLQDASHGTFSAITPEVSRIFHFSYHAGSQATNVWIDLGVGTDLYRISVKNGKVLVDLVLFINGIYGIWGVLCFLIIMAIFLMCSSQTRQQVKPTTEGRDKSL